LREVASGNLRTADFNTFSLKDLREVIQLLYGCDRKFGADYAFGVNVMI
jgi:hypothetical protein